MPTVKRKTPTLGTEDMGHVSWRESVDMQMQGRDRKSEGGRKILNEFR